MRAAENELYHRDVTHDRTIGRPRDTVGISEILHVVGNKIEIIASHKVYRRTRGVKVTSLELV